MSETVQVLDGLCPFNLQRNGRRTPESDPIHPLLSALPLVCTGKTLSS